MRDLQDKCCPRRGSRFGANYPLDEQRRQHNLDRPITDKTGRRLKVKRVSLQLL